MSYSQKAAQSLQQILQTRIQGGRHVGANVITAI